MRLSYVMKYVADMDRAVAFYRDVLGLRLTFQSPGWSEFATGETMLALHPASDRHPPGSTELGFQVGDIAAAHKDLSARGVAFTRTPEAEHGTTLATFLDCEGAEVSLAAET